MDPEVTRFVCNPLSGQLFRLPDIDGTTKTVQYTNVGILTQSGRPDQPPDKYTVAVLNISQDRRFVMRRFLSQTGKWDKLVGLPSRLPLARPMDMDMGAHHEAVAFAGRLWWVDVTCGALSVDPFSDRPELRFTELPRGSVTEPMDTERREELSRYRRIGVSEGRLRYAEVSQEEPFLLSSFTLDDDGSCWTLEHRVALRRLWPHEDLCENTPQIAVVDPLNASIMHLAIGRQVLSLDMVTGNLIRRVLICEHGPTINDVLKPCVLPPWLQSSKIPSAANWLGHGGVILVLFETPSGFALLKYNGVDLFCSGALKDTWVQFWTKRRDSAVCLLDFQIFKDKSVAINLETGLSNKLVKMIRSHYSRGQKLAVGKSDYKTIIEANLKIHCLFDEPVMELMWGLKHIMKSLVPAETCELTTEDRRHVSKGMELILSNYGFEVEPEMVDKELITIATALYESDYHTNRFADYLHYHGKFLKEVSGIDCQNWDLQKLAAALKLLSYPNEEIDTGTSNEMLSEDMKSRLVDQAHKYEHKLHKVTCLNIYKEILFARAVKSKALESLKAKGEAFSKAMEIGI